MARICLLITSVGRLYMFSVDISLEMLAKSGTVFKIYGILKIMSLKSGLEVTQSNLNSVL